MKKRILSMFLAVVMLITMLPAYTITSFAAASSTICPLTSFAEETEQNSERTVYLDKTSNYINCLTSYASRAEYLWTKESSYLEAIDFGETTEIIKSIIHTVDPDASVDSVFDSLLDIGFKSDVAINGVFYDSVYSDKYLLENMNLCAEDIETISVESKVNNSRTVHEYVISLKDCCNPQKDNKSAIDHVTNDFITIDEFAEEIQENNASFEVDDSSYFNYQDITINMSIMDGLIFNLKISYTVDIDLDLKVATMSSKAKGKVIVNNEYDYINHSDVSDLSEVPYKNFKYVFLDDDTVEIEGYSNTTGELIVPSEIAGFSVSTIGARAFEGSAFKNVYISSGVKTIGQSAFYDCHLGNVTLPNTIELIERDAFYSTIIYDVIENFYYTGTADEWVKISFENNPFWRATNAYFNGELITDVALSEEVTSISNNAFSGCESLTSITIPDSVIEIGEYAFGKCKSLKYVKLSNSIDEIPKSIFDECTALKSIIIPDGVTTIGEYAFEECYSLNNIIIPDSVTTIENAAFYVCNSLDSVLYKGTESQWDSILIEGINNDVLHRANITFEYEKINGWMNENGKWAYYQNNVKVTNKWLMDSVGWCYVGADGYCVTNCWKADSKGWCYLDANGRMVINNWVLENGKWYFMDANGYMVSNCWKKDSKGWCYLGSSGAMLTNAWVKDSVGWCYVGADGYCVTNKWVKDSKGWCYLDAQGRMVYNKWVKDSKGWCYVGSSGYMVTSQWVQDGGKWYYLDVNGYMVTGTKVINGKTYKFNSSGVWIA